MEYKEGITEITTVLGVYSKAVVTHDYVYFVNYEESDENGSVIMFRSTNGKLMSNNYFAFASLIDEIEHGDIVWLSEEMKDNVEQIKKEEV